MVAQRTIIGLARVRDRLRARGIPVTEVPGWQRRGSGSMTPRGGVMHHTGPGSWAGLLSVLTHGHAGIGANALCTWAVPLDGHAAYLVAAGTAWHAGKGGWRGLSGNSSVFGIEAQNSGSQPWTQRSLDVQAAITEEMCREFGIPPENICEHREWAPGRKVDRHSVAGASWRARIAAALSGAAQKPPAPAAPAPPPILNPGFGGRMIRRVWHPNKQRHFPLWFGPDRTWSPITDHVWRAMVAEAGGEDRFKTCSLKEAAAYGDFGMLYGGYVYRGLSPEAYIDRPDRLAEWERAAKTIPRHPAARA